jgi:hypothetical protein
VDTAFVRKARRGIYLNFQTYASDLFLSLCLLTALQPAALRVQEHGSGSM